MPFEPTKEQWTELKRRFDAYTEIQWRTVPMRFSAFLASSEGKMLLLDDSIAPYMGKAQQLLDNISKDEWLGTPEQRYALLALDYFVDEYDLQPDSSGPQGLEDDIFVMEMCCKKLGV